MAEGSKTESPGAALVRLRWAKTDAAERLRVANMMVAARRKKARKAKAGKARG